MSLFYGSVKGASKTEAGRRGHKSIESHTRTWDFGVQVEGFKYSDGRVGFYVWRTGGSDNPSQREFITVVDHAPPAKVPQAVHRGS